MRKFSLFLLFSLVCMGTYAQDTSRLMFYNLLRFPGSSPNRITHLKKIVDYSKPDILMVCELESSTGGISILNNALNVNGKKSFKRSIFWDDGSLNNQLFYDGDKFRMVKQDTLDGWPRFTTAYFLLHKGAYASGDSIVYTILISHLKAGNTSSDEKSRANAVKRIRRYIDKETDGENVFLSGDLNVYSSSEEGFDLLVNKGTNKLYDPVGQLGDWNNSGTYAKVHTQSTRTTSFGGGSSGGMDDRFDWILVSRDVIRGEKGLQYVSGSYKAVGQDGQRFNRAINHGTNTAVPADIAESLHEMSDHLPVITDVAVKFVSVGTELAKNEPSFSIKENLILVKTADISALKIYSLNGQLLYSQGFSGDGVVRLKELGLEGGVYVVQHTTSTGTKVEKIFLIE